jgi:hypothetical protein
MLYYNNMSKAEPSKEEIKKDILKLLKYVETIDNKAKQIQVMKLVQSLEKKLEKKEEEPKKEEPPPKKVSVGKIQIKGKLYYKSNDNILYDPDTKEEVGLWNPETKTIEELPDEEDEEDDDEEDDEEEEPPPIKVQVTRIQINGKKYLKSSSNILYDPDTHTEVGIWNPETKTIEELPDDDDEDDDEDEEEVSKDDLFAFLDEPREDKRKDNLTKEQIISRIDELEKEKDKLYEKKEKKQDEYLIKNPKLMKKINKNNFLWRTIFYNLKISEEEDKRLDEIEDELKDIRFNQKNYDFIKEGRGLGINNYSNPKVVQSKAKKYLGKDTLIQLSNKKDKKYMVYDPNTEKMIHFGQMGYEDFTKHKDPKRRENYLKRTANMKGNWKDNKYSANNLSRNLLW